MKFSDFQNRLDLTAPIHANIEVTNRCNLQCVFCSADSNEIPGSDELSMPDLMSIADQLEEMKVFRVKITGGEPFLKKGIMGLLSRLSKRHRISINTNGTLITGEIAGELARLNIDTMIVSLDSADPGINDRLRGRDSSRRTVEGIKILRKFNIPVSIAAVLTKLNADGIPELALFLKGLGFSKLGVNYVYPKGRGVNRFKELALNYDELESFCFKINDFNKANPGMSISFEQAHWYKMKYSFQEKKEGKKKYLLPCHAGISQIGILSNGDVVPCLLMASLKAGNIKREKLADMWKNSDVFKKMKELATTEIHQTECGANCRFNYFCRGGCRARAYLYSGSLTGKDPECPH
ncbi:MAG: radical SAM protein, partial [Candidatus Aminicenantes bacterium]|nr:radical SAM protein [Candidatus Aminicenantes bacterium]